MFVYLLLAAASALVYYLLKTFTYWEQEGIPFEKPSIPFGCLKSLIRMERSFGMAIYDVYNKSKEPFLGIYLMIRPAILVRDATLCKDMLTKDFSSFHDRGIYVDEENDPFSGNLFAAEGQSWKTLRSKLTMQSMHPTILETADKLKNCLQSQLSKGESKVIEIKDLMNSYAIDIIASVIFGIEIDSFKNPENEFRVAGRQNDKPNFFNNFMGACFFLFPQLIKMMARLKLKDPTTTLMKRVVKDTVEYREKNKVVRKDLMQMLIQLRNSGKINEDDDNWKIQTVAGEFFVLILKTLIQI